MIIFVRSIRKVLSVLMALGLCLLPCAGTQAKTTRPSLETLTSQLTTPELLEKYMKKNFRYVSDQALFGEEEHWQTASETAARCQGDCEDYALFAQAILKKNGHNAFIVSVYWNEDAHTVTLFEKDKKWGVFNLEKLIYTDAVSLKDLANVVHPDWSSIALMRQEGVLGVISRKFQGNVAEQSKIATVFVPGSLLWVVSQFLFLMGGVAKRI